MLRHLLVWAYITEQKSLVVLSLTIEAVQVKTELRILDTLQFTQGIWKTVLTGQGTILWIVLVRREDLLLEKFLKKLFTTNIHIRGIHGKQLISNNMICMQDTLFIRRVLHILFA